ncbi:hypothetical protein DACRYDRAFT_105624 [Dacryopinax primogenitus]|uniref:C2H2-type domain-containing protein n=1 Tax=Dacryopinax primogenitus (strain DJM 731) TaxID=1858805 RepID=M5GEP8_DACPD|nr:uncharacterized protein DACRYDRAFT_105624 [Dacryopinax primogenitus]EJU03463.1 hypothetical protein DACRYDRAFT_105624 [Dacryopinax primogenitus]
MTAAHIPCLTERDGEGPVRKTFDCDKCGSKYSRAEYLRRHARKHENVYPFKCPYPNCTKEFARSDVLLRHRRRQHPTSPPPSQAQNNKRLAPDPSPPISPVSPSHPKSRRRRSGPSAYWGEQTLRFTPPPNAYFSPGPTPAPPLSPPADFPPSPSSQDQDLTKFSLSLDPDLPDFPLHPHSLPIVPPFQLSAAYSPTSPLYAPPLPHLSPIHAHPLPSPPGYADLHLLIPSSPGPYSPSPYPTPASASASAFPGGTYYPDPLRSSWSPPSPSPPVEEPHSPYPAQADYPRPHTLLPEPSDLFFPHHQDSAGGGAFAFVDLQRLLREKGEYVPMLGEVGGP